ncbi:DNA repair protein RadC [Paeniroseomonas aquatica]|uniref:DNA repair protein RadC n=1 Tax=Paeniroseomonas aquatica TaxID=373043 RepID=A0ABT8A1K0_9PROT|nr:DNA repair protein RadC [Paeniroseomonas aquatica]MDN3563368.1 DNA repair protein RadC [Paeniroseomonas aquatica]
MRRAGERKGLAEAGLAGLPLELPRACGPAGPRPAPPPDPPGHLGHRERMRQRLLLAGPDALADYELLEMVLFLALPRQDTKPLARALIARFGSFANAIAAPLAELRQVEGIRDAGAAALKTVQAAALRLAGAELRGRDLLANWEQLLAYLNAHVARAPVEEVHVLFLDTRNRLLADEVQGRGTVNHTPVYPREVVKRALELQATALILVHNHPSGDPTPSRADIEMTAEIKAAAAVFGVVLHDHLIIGNGRQTSLRREGLL